MRDTWQEPLTWSRPDFLALRYQLHSPAGLVAQVSVDGMGDLKHALGETAEGAWRFQVFPFASDLVSVRRAGDDGEAGSYLRQPPFEIRLASGATYRQSLPEASNPRTTLEDEAGRPVFWFEQLESFPKWQAEVRLAPEAIEIPDLPVLVISACCLRVFR